MLFREFSVTAEGVFLPKRISSQPFDLFLSNPPTTSFQACFGMARFQYQSGSPLTKDALTSETRSLLAMSGVNPMQYAGHSYRIEATTTAASVGLPILPG